MTLALALFYWGGAAALALPGLALFAALALARPDLALLFVPLTAPLYLIPAEITGLRAGSFLVPPHEAALLATAAAFGARWLWARRWQALRLAPVAWLRAYAPHLLLLLAGALGVLLAVERGRALREFRWVVAEPLLFYALARLLAAGEPADASRSAGLYRRLLAAFALGGALVGLLGLLQYAGIDLVPLLGRKQCFAPDGGPCANIVADGGVRRVLSVYGHPNNLGLALGRIWPVAAALALGPALAGWRARRRFAFDQRSVFFAVCALLSLGGLLVSFSRGAWLGAAAALGVLALGLTGGAALPAPAGRRASWRWLIGVGGAVAIVAGLALSLRGDVTAGSTPIRLLLWREAIGYIARHPLGIGLDQFGVYHDPASPLTLIDPALVGTSEQFAAHPHNLLLDIWLRLGPLGLIAFGWLLARFFRAGRARAGHMAALGATAAMAAALVHGMVDNFYFLGDLAIFFWLLVALVDLAPDTRKDRPSGV
jgi:hypothetical protein